MEKLAYPRGIFHPTVQWVLEAGQFALLSFSSFLCLCVGMCTYKYMELYMSIFVYIHVYVFIYIWLIWIEWFGWKGVVKACLVQQPEGVHRN